MHSNSRINENSTAFLIRESDLLESSGSFEGEFVDSSFGSDESDCGNCNNGGVLTAPPSLESLLNNLSLDIPILSTQKTKIITNTSANANANANVNNATSNNSSQHTISWLGCAFRWERSTENNFIIDAGSTDTKPIILYASKMKLIEKLTTVLDYRFMDDFLLTVEMIMHPMEFVTCLLSRLAQAFKAVPGWNSRDEVIDPEVVKMRGLVVLQHWAGIHTRNGDNIENVLDFSIRKVVIEALDHIWQHSRTLSQSDQRFLIKIRRLYDPRGEISTTNTPEDGANDVIISSDTSSVFDSDSGQGEDHSDELIERLNWRDKLKMRLKSFFSNNRNTTKLSRSNSISSTQSPSSFLINSFTSDTECNEDVSSVLLTQRSKTLASILSVLEWDLFRGIQRGEIVSFPLTRESPQRLAETCPNLQRVIEHFNSMCQWFVQLIINQEEHTGSMLLAKLIRLAVKCVMIHNYNTALQIILALQSPGVSARKDLWLSLPSWERRLAKDLAVFGSPVKNFKNVRRSLEEVHNEDVPVIPFNGLFLSDLVFNWERSSGSKNDQGDSIFNNDQQLIPFFKNHLAAKIIRQFLAFQSPQHRFERALSGRERQLYSYFADIGRLGGEFSM